MKHALIAVCFVLGLILAGSEGAWFPWLNLVGLVVFGAIVPLTWRDEP